MTARSKVLFVAPVEPWCRENGSSLITADLLDGLTASDEIELLPIFVRRPPSGYERRPPQDLEGVLLDIPALPRWVSVLAAVARGSSPLRHRFDNGRVARRVRQVLGERRFQPDLVHVEHLPLVDIGLKVARSLGRPLVYRAHNVESELWARRLDLPRVLKNAVVAHMERLETDAVRSVDLTLCISSRDLEWARSNAPDARSELLPCSLRLDRYDAIPEGPPVFDPQVCFVGGLDWEPNKAGLRWFVLEVLPQITRQIPHAGLAVLSRGADRHPWLRDNPSVRILAPENGAAELFASSRVSIAPLFQGGGVRIKIPESLAVGCPVIATRIGAEGHDLLGLTRADDPAEFAEACLCHLKREGRTESREALRAGVEARYGASILAERLVELWSRSIRGQDTRKSAPSP